jgi:hypothetical protein
MKRIRLLYVLLWMLALPAWALAQDIEDIEGRGQMGPVVWEPIISEFFVLPPDRLQNLPSGAIAKSTPGGGQAYGEKLQWLELKKLIAPRGSWEQGSQPYKEDEPVLSGWQRTVDAQDRTEFVMHHSGTEKPDWEKKVGLPFCVPWEKNTLLVRVGLDVLMNREIPADKEKILTNFKVLELKVTAACIAKSKDDFRAAVPAAPTVLPAGVTIGKEGDLTGFDFGGREGIVPSPGAVIERAWDYPKPEPGQAEVFELRVKARVLGREHATAEPEVKTVEGAIRIVIVPEKSLVVERLKLDSTGKYNKGKTVVP